MKDNNPTLYAAASALALMLGTTTSAHSALIAVDGFDYPVGTIASSGGTGWTTNWDGSAQAVTGSLTYPGVANVGANSYLGTGNHFRTLDLTAPSLSGLLSGGKLGADNTTLWLSFIGERTSGTGYAGISLFNNTSEVLFFGHSGGNANNNWIIRSGGSNSADSGVLLDDQAFILVKMEFLSGNEAISMWANPDLSGGEAGLGLPDTTRSAGNFLFDRIRIGSGGNFAADEFRLGSSYGSVIPEPSSAALVALGGLALLRRRKR